jgi:SpoVK/Ycf46/Vps4 family AAA+-type ATPase
VRACTLPCAQDEYECGAWSQCQENGRERRVCKLKKDCLSIRTPKPKEEQICPNLRCGHRASLEDRISCRLGLTNEELVNEFQILYFPEYCKGEETPAAKKICIERYQSFGPCWRLPPGKERGECAKRAIGMRQPTEEKAICLREQGERRKQCVDALKEKIESLLIFHLYELEVQAETLLEQRKVSTDDVVQLEVFIEIKKQEIDRAKNVGDWKAAIALVKAYWNEFKTKVRQ